MSGSLELPSKATMTLKLVMTMHPMSKMLKQSSDNNRSKEGIKIVEAMTLWELKVQIMSQWLKQTRTKIRLMMVHSSFQLLVGRVKNHSMMIKGQEKLTTQLQLKRRMSR